MESQQIFSGFCPNSSLPSIPIGKKPFSLKFSLFSTFFSHPTYKPQNLQLQSVAFHPINIEHKVCYSSRNTICCSMNSTSEPNKEGFEVRDQITVRRKKLAVFVSGGGSNFRSIHEASLKESLHGDIVVLVTNKTVQMRLCCGPMWPHHCDSKSHHKCGVMQLRRSPQYCGRIRVYLYSCDWKKVISFCSSAAAPVSLKLPMPRKFEYCGGAEYARNNGIPVILFPKNKDESDGLSPSDLVNTLRRFKVDFILLAGYLKLIPVELIRAYQRSIFNIHPSLLPAFGGKGYYGMKVHKAVIASGARFSGPTIHFVDENYDTGRILAQRVVPVLANDTAEELAARVLREEHRLYVEVVKAICEERVVWREDGVPLIRSKENPNDFS
ncbi:hypothetical protein Lal_00030331 [Lupinus albus]|nr:hypothetical protein Lal_00030331 [Lupinus albus]